MPRVGNGAQLLWLERLKLWLASSSLCGLRRIRLPELRKCILEGGTMILRPRTRKSPKYTNNMELEARRTPSVGLNFLRLKKQCFLCRVFCAVISVLKNVHRLGEPVSSRRTSAHLERRGQTRLSCHSTPPTSSARTQKKSPSIRISFPNQSLPTYLPNRFPIRLAREDPMETTESGEDMEGMVKGNGRKMSEAGVDKHQDESDCDEVNSKLDDILSTTDVILDAKLDVVGKIGNLIDELVESATNNAVEVTENVAAKEKDLIAVINADAQILAAKIKERNDQAAEQFRDIDVSVRGPIEGSVESQ
ncbi:unnamed protein product [Nesidiocoris tenuis]|uniref:Uncharacterized protein n=1 Tax=Nesidiocoris tenuis TaxID=355587 RepID=A0A6H5FW91_9HEMI|nr:unnamed protein product [Nesidiocoris tenuis]